MDVLAILGSKSDLAIGEEIEKIFVEFGIECDLHIASAHRTPERVRALVASAEKNGAKAIIACAGMSAHLAGVVASETILPVIGVPVASGNLGGVDALLSTVNMPGGVPVATVSIGKAGGKNAALLASRIIALSDEKVAVKLQGYREKMARDVDEADAGLQGERSKN